MRYTSTFSAQEVEHNLFFLHIAPEAFENESGEIETGVSSI